MLNIIYSNTANNKASRVNMGVLLRGDFSTSALGTGDSIGGIPTPARKNLSSAGQNNVGTLMGQLSGRLETFWSKNWFSAATKTATTGCAMSWQVSYPIETITTDGQAPARVVTTGVVGAYTSYFHQSSADHLTLADFSYTGATATPTATATMNNYYIYGVATNPTIDTALTSLAASTIPTTVRITGILNGLANAGPGGYFYNSYSCRHSRCCK